MTIARGWAGRLALAAAMPLAALEGGAQGRARSGVDADAARAAAAPVARGEAPPALPAGGGPWAGPCDEGGRPATRAAVAAAAVGGNVALLLYFKQAWWSGERADRFFFQTDWDGAFRDQDKLGHAFGGYHLTRAGVEFLGLACVSRRKAVLASAAYATLFQLQIEIWDGFFETYGFSYPDVVMNAAGAALTVSHEYAPRSRAVTPTIWYKPTRAWHRRGEHGGHPRATTDYSGQSYWLSVDVDTLLPPGARRYWPGLLRMSVGHSITDWIDPSTGESMRARRRILITLDLDASKLPGDNPTWLFVKRQLAHLHLPGPAIQLTPVPRGIAWYP